jgi:DNA-directed RNA polymerase subunit L
MDPVVEIVSQSDVDLQFIVRHIDLAVANALRRIILSEVENVAVVHENVLVSINTCPLHDDIISKRIAMIPLKLSPIEVAAYVPNSLTIELHVKNDTKLPLDVTSENVDVLIHGRPHPDKQVILPPCPISGDYILITRLQPGQEIKLGATASKGTADMHASYAVTSIASYGYEKDDVAIAAARKVVEANTDLDEKDMRNALNRFDTIDCQRLYKKEEDGTPMGFVFTVESESGFPCSTIVDIATSILRTKFIDPDYTITFIRGDETYASYVIKNEAYSMGGVLQSTAVDNAEKMGIISAGYYRPHPLEDQIVMNIKTKVPIKDPEAMMSEMCELCVERVEKLQTAFTKVFAK